jgi:hypothetical protein
MELSMDIHTVGTWVDAQGDRLCLNQDPKSGFYYLEINDPTGAEQGCFKLPEGPQLDQLLAQFQSLRPGARQAQQAQALLFGFRERVRQAGDCLERGLAEGKKGSAYLALGAGRLQGLAGELLRLLDEAFQDIASLAEDLRELEQVSAEQQVPDDSSPELRDMVGRYGHQEDTSTGRCALCGAPVEVWLTDDDAGDWSLLCPARMAGDLLLKHDDAAPKGPEPRGHLMVLPPGGEE